MGHSRKKIDLTGQQYGHLTVLEPAENIGKRTAWLCQCDCGRQVVVKTNRLRGGNIQSCGCKNDSGGSRNALGLTYIDGTCVEMLAARTVRSNNTSGVTGVEWVPASNKWKAVIFFKGRRYYLGCYEKFEDAVKARKRGEEEYHNKFLEEFAAGNTEESG